MVRALVFVVAVGCYSATPASNVPCAENGMCPKGQACDFSRPIPTCVDELGSDTDASFGDSSIDAAPPGPAGATLWLRFDDDPTDGAVDSAGMHVAICTPCPAAIPGKQNGAYNFKADLFTVTPTQDFAPGTGFTIALWVRLGSAPPDPFATLAARLGPGSAPTYAIFIQPDRTVTFYSTPGDVLDGPALALDTWHHVALVWDGNVKRGYVDGIVVATEVIGALQVANNPLWLGSYGGQGLELDGTLDEVYFYPRALSAAEVLARYSQ